MPRPAPRFHDFVGHKAIVDYLRRQLAGAQARKEPFPHTLMLGPSGIGKTHLARALAAEYGTKVIEAMGYVDRSALIKLLTRLDVGDFLFIDEAHRLKSMEQETLCEAIDQGSIPIADGKTRDPGGERVDLKPWSLILATDQPGLLLDALRKRIVIEVPLTYYPDSEVKEIVETMASDLNVLVSPQAARLLAEVSGGLPRRAKQHLKNLRLYHPQAESQQLGLDDVREYLDAAGIDKSGLGLSERRYLQIVADLGGASVESIALSLGTDTDFVRRQIEPGLVRRGLVKITSVGRQITCTGESIMQDRVKESN